MNANYHLTCSTGAGGKSAASLEMRGDPRESELLSVLLLSLLPVLPMLPRLPDWVEWSCGETAVSPATVSSAPGLPPGGLGRRTRSSSKNYHCCPVAQPRIGPRPLQTKPGNKAPLVLHCVQSSEHEKHTEIGKNLSSYCTFI